MHTYNAVTKISIFFDQSLSLWIIKLRYNNVKIAVFNKNREFSGYKYINISIKHQDNNKS